VNIKELSYEKLMAALTEIRDEVSARDHAAEEAENSKHVGKCFVNKNCYSCPEKRSDYWNVYSYVIECSEGSGVNVLQFQIDKYGSVFISKNHSYVHMLGKKISREAFDKAAFKLVNKAAEELMVSIQAG
jgi:hypothetical protein